MTDTVIKCYNCSREINVNDAIEVMEKYTGLDMRERFIAKMIPYEIESRAMKVAPAFKEAKQ